MIGPDSNYQPSFYNIFHTTSILRSEYLRGKSYFYGRGLPFLLFFLLSLIIITIVNKCVNRTESYKEEKVVQNAVLQMGTPSIGGGTSYRF